MTEDNKMHALGGVKARNRRMPNGTYGGVGGRLLNQWVASYPIDTARWRLAFWCAIKVPLPQQGNGFSGQTPGDSENTLL